MDKEKTKKNAGISCRVSEMLEFLNESRNSFATKLGYDRAQTIYDIINGKSAPSYDFFRRFQLSEFSDTINIDWLLTGRGNMTADKSDSDNTAAPEEPIRAFRTDDPTEGIPLIPLDAMAGALSGESSQIYEYHCDRYIVPIFEGADFLITVKGSSMTPTFHSGDVVACRRVALSGLFFQWGKVYVIDTDQGPLIKRIKQASAKDAILIVSDNPDYAPFELSADGIHGIALVIGTIHLE
jgi:phage repressor protein C with HTH and peptisase S24 domain